MREKLYRGGLDGTENTFAVQVWLRMEKEQRIVSIQFTFFIIWAIIPLQATCQSGIAQPKVLTFI